MSINLVSIRKWFFFISGIIMLGSLILLAIPPALVPGIEFTSGTTALYRFSEDSADEDGIRLVYESLNHPEVRVQHAGDEDFLIRIGDLGESEENLQEVTPAIENLRDIAGPVQDLPIATLNVKDTGLDTVAIRSAYKGDPCKFGNISFNAPPGTELFVYKDLSHCDQGIIYEVTFGDSIGYINRDSIENYLPIITTRVLDENASEREKIEFALANQFGEFETLEFASVSPLVSRVAVRNATIAVIVATLFILGYVAFAFSSVPKPFRYGACAIFALIHDVVIVLGAFSLFGKLFNLEINLMFVTALLTVVGFSVHDSIVVFDRIRENVRLSPSAPFAENVNAALIQTLSRSLNTSITLLVTVTAMLLLGGDSIQSFLLTIFIGLIVGTYSSIAIAAQLLVAWENGEFARIKDRIKINKGSESI